MSEDTKGDGKGKNKDTKEVTGDPKVLKFDGYQVQAGKPSEGSSNKNQSTETGQKSGNDSE